MLHCQFCPQFLPIGIHPVLDPFTFTATTSPSKPTLVIKTWKKRRFPLTVNLNPPLLAHFTLHKIRHKHKQMFPLIVRWVENRKTHHPNENSFYVFWFVTSCIALARYQLFSLQFQQMRPLTSQSVLVGSCTSHHNRMRVHNLEDRNLWQWE